MLKINSFKFQDSLYNLFIADAELLEIMGNPTDDEERNLRFRREDFDISEIDSENFPFMTITFADANESDNCLRNIGILEINIFTSTRYTASVIYDIMNKIIRYNLNDMKIISEGQVYAGVRGMYCYRIRYNPVINA